MVDLLWFIFLLIGAFFILIKSSDYLVESATILGKRAGLSKFLIGLTIVAVGTSLPELFTGIAGVLSSQNADSFVLGTIIGSNISNILLIFGILLFASKHFKSHTQKIDIYALVCSTVALLTLIYIQRFNIFLSLLYLTIYIGYLYLSIKNTKKDLEDEVQDLDETFFSNKSTPIVLFFFLLSLFGLNIAAKGVVYGIDNIGLILVIPSTYLTLTTVALATSLPEAVVTYTSAKRKQFDLAIGNIIGSNISNVFMITGIIGLIKQFTFDSLIYMQSSVILIIATLLFVIYLNKKSIDKIHGIGLIAIYSIYIVSTFFLN